MRIQKGQDFELEIDDIVFGGKGLARIDGLAVFVRQVVSQDRVLARITKKKRNYAEARVVEYLDPSPYRIKAPCPYSGHCGGCTWQYLQYERQLLFKH